MAIVIIELEWLNPIYSQLKSHHYKEIKPYLQYTHVWWSQGKHKKEREEKILYVGRKKKNTSYHMIHSGFIPRVRKYCQRNMMELEVIGNIERIEPTNDIHVKDVTLRQDQIDLVHIACEEQRGVIVAPSRTGKTVVMMGFISRFPDCKILVLCDRTSIISQTEKKFSLAGLGKIGMMGGGRKTKNRITVASIQSFIKTIDTNEYNHEWDIVIVDETHRVSKFDGQYAKVLECLTAPIRLGFTATMPTKELARLALEGLIGPKIGEVTLDQAEKLGLVMMPKIRILKSEFSPDIRSLKSYAAVYDSGIVNNRDRHHRVLDAVKEYLDDNKTVLILVRKRRHGKMLQRIAELRNIQIKYIHGGVGLNARDKVQEAFNDKTVKCVIATAAWKEGIDIPTLDVVFNAAGGKDELPTIQSTSRCLTVAEGKERAIIHDVFDPSHPYLVDHFGHRLAVYTEKGWL